ncbi:hypothetical protein BHE74_00009190 [Ensete ventricosum]|nr:hypothetical protein BHE74_00009190 [Ensete ventricosum]
MAHHVAAPHALPPYWWGGVRLQVGVADLTCARSVVRHLVPFVHPVDRSRRFGHVSGLAVRRCDDLAARSDFALSISDKKPGTFVSGNEIVIYESPRPQAGIHRIALVLFRQQVQQTVHAPGWRQNFSTRDFAAFHNLGLPAAAAFFNCQRESGCGGRR